MARKELNWPKKSLRKRARRLPRTSRLSGLEKKDIFARVYFKLFTPTPLNV